MYSLIGLVTVVALSSRAFADCYFPNGDVSGSDTACNPNSLVSACCFDGQACLSNGLCVSDPHNDTLARLHRGTCTDKSWKSGNCPRECTSIDNNGVPVYSCNQTNTDSYCCFDNCECNSNFEVFSFTTNDVYTLTIIGESFTNTHTSTASSAAASTTGAASAKTTGASAASATATSTSTSAASTSSNDDDSSNATAIGVGVGVGVGGALLIGAAAFFFWRRKKRNDPENSTYAGSAKNPAEVANTEYYPPSQKYAYYAENSSQNSAAPFVAAPSELPSDNSHNPVELPASPPADGRDAKRIPGL